MIVFFFVVHCHGATVQLQPKAADRNWNILAYSVPTHTTSNRKRRLKVRSPNPSGSQFLHLQLAPLSSPASTFCIIIELMTRTLSIKSPTGGASVCLVNSHDALQICQQLHGRFIWYNTIFISTKLGTFRITMCKKYWHAVWQTPIRSLQICCYQQKTKDFECRLPKWNKKLILRKAY